MICTASHKECSPGSLGPPTSGYRPVQTSAVAIGNGRNVSVGRYDIDLQGEALKGGQAGASLFHADGQTEQQTKLVVVVSFS